MTEKPIPFTAPMVRAILADTKTQTRRIMKPQPHEDWSPAHYGDLHGYDKDGALTPDKVIGWGPVNDDGECGYRSPYGKPGDRLWVREDFRFPDNLDNLSPIAVGEKAISAGYPKPWCPTQYEADGTRRTAREWADFTVPRHPAPGKLRPSMFMPRWASRLTLEVVSVRVERLQDISRGDAMAEGCPFQNTAKGPDPRQWFQGLWDQINGPGSWAKNPWVWVVEFMRQGS